MKALIVLATVLLQNTSFTSKSKDNVETFKRRLKRWKNGQIEKLLLETKTIQERLFKDSAKNQSSDDDDDDDDDDEHFYSLRTRFYKVIYIYIYNRLFTPLTHFNK